MKATEKVKNIIAKLGSSYERTHLTFNQLKTENIKAQLNLKEEALARGKKNLPPTTATGFDDIEQKIVTDINYHVNVATQSYYDDMSTFEDRMNRLNAASNAGKVENIAISAEADFQSHVHKRKDELYTARVVVTGCEADLENFKKENGLERSARYPTTKIWYVALAALFFTIETYVNSMFFAQGSEMGLLGGIVIAFGPSFMNSISGFYLGNYAFRLVIHKRPLRRMMGVLMCCVLIGIALALNLLLAHYRSEMLAMTEFSTAQATVRALKSFRESPFTLNDVESWFLFAMGVVFFLGATIGFWNMDDAYLDYGAIAKNHKEKLDYYARKKAAILEELEDVRDDRLEDLEIAADVVSQKASEANAVYDSKQRWTLLYKEHLTHLEGAGRELLSYYHTVNMGERTDTPPAYFQKEWIMDRPNLPEPGIDFLQVLSGFKSEVTGIQSLYVDCSKRIGKAYLEALKEFDTIDQLQPEELKKWLTEKNAEVAVEKLATAA